MWNCLGQVRRVKAGIMHPNYTWNDKARVQFNPFSFKLLGLAKVTKLSSMLGPVSSRRVSNTVKKTFKTIFSIKLDMRLKKLALIYYNSLKKLQKSIQEKGYQQKSVGILWFLPF
jgi:hypothetical protein